MSDSESTASGLYHGLPVLSHNNFNEWKIQVTAYLTGISDHVRIISHCPNVAGILSDLVCPTVTAEATKWDASECMALSVIMSMASKLHTEIILHHCDSGKPVFKLWEKVGNMHQSCNALLCHQAWLQFFSVHKTTNESYLELASRMEGLWAKIDHLTPVAQTREERRAELTLLGILFALPYKDHIHQSLLTQSNLTLEQAQEALIHIDTGRQLHIEGADSANVAHSVNCWTCKLPGHLSHQCLHTEAIKDLLIK